MPVDVAVSKTDLHQIHVLESPASPLAEGQLRLRIDKFAITSNNVTYALFGGAPLHYWSFFPIETGPAPEGLGRVPAWGFAEVIESRVPDLAVGERIFGYVPMSSEVVFTVGQVTPASLVETSAHRAGMKPLYNVYTRMAGHPLHQPRHDDLWPVLWPLALTGHLLAKHLAGHAFSGARRVVIASASSKTGLALAHALIHGHPGEVEVVGLTSAPHLDLVRRAVPAARVIAYDDLASLERGVPTVFVDVAGSARVLTAVHQHLREDLVESVMLGMTHWTDFHGLAPSPELPGAAPYLYQVTEHAERAVADLGLENLIREFAPLWFGFLAPTPEWLHVVRGRGAEAVKQAWLAVLDGKVGPDAAHVLSLD